MKVIEFRVRPVTRYIVTKYTADLAAASVETVGEFPNEQYAEMVADALDFASGTFRQRRNAGQSEGGADPHPYPQDIG